MAFLTLNFVFLLMILTAGLSVFNTQQKVLTGMDQQLKVTRIKR